MRVSDHLHATGGLRAKRGAGGWMVGPLPHSTSELIELGPVPAKSVKAVLAELGAEIFGSDEVTELDPLLPSRIWTPLLDAPHPTIQSADAWGAIAAAAHAASDREYAALAQSVAASLRAAGIRLRDASDQYHAQLQAALVRGERPGKRFSNVALTDLHLAFHSLLSEMGSARDYLATVAARRVGAPEKVDAANRLADWIGRGIGRDAASDPVVGRIIAAWEKTGAEPWLHDLTEHRNFFLHRQPLAVGEQSRWLNLFEHGSRHGRVLLLTMQIEERPGRPELCDALTRFVGLYAKLCRLAGFAATYARFTAAPPTFVASP